MTSAEPAGPASSPLTSAGAADTPPAARAYLAQVQARFEAARRASGAYDEDVILGGRRLSLRFAGKPMHEAFALPFRHLSRAPAGEPVDMTICVFDGESSGVGVPPAGWGPDDIRERNQVRGLNEGGARTIHDPVSGAITAVDLGTARAFYLHPAISRIPWYERAAPLRVSLHLLLPQQDVILLHAAAVGIGGQGVVIGGRSGSGKSTMALASGLAGHDYVGDDYVALAQDGGPTAHSVHSTAKVSETTLGLIPELAPAIRIRNEEKITVDVDRLEGVRMAESLPVRAIVMPRVTRGEPRLEPISGGEALLGLAPSTILQLPTVGSGTLERMRALASSVPAYSLTVGDDPRAAVELLAGLPDRLPGAATEGTR